MRLCHKYQMYSKMKIICYVGVVLLFADVELSVRGMLYKEYHRRRLFITSTGAACGGAESGGAKDARN